MAFNSVVSLCKIIKQESSDHKEGLNPDIFHCFTEINNMYWSYFYSYHYFRHKWLSTSHEKFTGTPSTRCVPVWDLHLVMLLAEQVQVLTDETQSSINTHAHSSQQMGCFSLRVSCEHHFCCVCECPWATHKPAQPCLNTTFLGKPEQ